MKYKELLKKYDLTDKQIGEWFGYKNYVSWRNSTRKEKVMSGVVELILFLEGRKK